MKRITETISISELEEMSKNMFGELVKAVVDINNEEMIVDAPMHADQEKEFLENGSDQKDLWGINLYPEMYGEEDFIEFNSMINIRPSQNNRSRSVESEEIRKKIFEIVDQLVTE
jgi:hypothetical protein